MGWIFSNAFYCLLRYFFFLLICWIYFKYWILTFLILEILDQRVYFNVLVIWDLNNDSIWSFLMNIFWKEILFFSIWDTVFYKCQFRVVDDIQVYCFSIHTVTFVFYFIKQQWNTSVNISTMIVFFKQLFQTNPCF